MAREGVGILRTGRNNPAARCLFDTGRWQRVAIPYKIGRHTRYLHISNLHANPGGTAEDKERKERLIRWVLEDAATLGDQPVILSMDANMDIWKSKAASAALTSGEWFDVGVLYAGTEGPEPTFNASRTWDRKGRQGSTRPDVMLVNKPAKAALTGFEVVRNLPTCGHLGLKAHFNLARAEGKETTVRATTNYEW